MKNIKIYNLFILISTITRNIIDIYSVVYLYQKGLSFKEIIAIYSIIYFLGYFISTYSLKLGNIIGYKYILILSTIFTSISYYIINNSNHYLIALFLSLSMFTYHPVKHYYGIKLLKTKKQISHVLVLTYLSTLISSYIAIKKINTIYIIFISLISIIPALFIKKESIHKIQYQNKIPQHKLKFYIFDQFKIIFLLLEPLYLYLLFNNLQYVGIFNIILTISSIICFYLLINKINITKNYVYLNLIFSLILLLKLNITNKYLLLVLAFLEGIGIKSNELVSTINLYDIKYFNLEYLILSEKIFCLVRTILLAIIYFLNIKIKFSMYLLIIGIILLSFTFKSNKKNTI